MSPHTDARRTLLAWSAPDVAQSALRDEFVAFLDAHPDGTDRSCRDGHVTTSALVVQPGRGRVLLTQHAVVGRWLQLGGHCEPGDPTLAASAAREAREESGIDDLVLSAAPLRVDRHQVRCRHDGTSTVLDHLDVQYVAIAREDAVEIAEGAAALGWFGWDELPSDADAALRALADAARRAC